jgi:hypothetical protein
MNALEHNKNSVSRHFAVQIACALSLVGAIHCAAAADDDAEREMKRIQQRVLTQGKVCPDPAQPCAGFNPNELSFKIGKKFDFDRGQDKSLPFYAAILKSAALCSITEDERLKVQALFPQRKVFVHQYFCQGFGDKVTYTNVNPNLGFIAVYAGETDTEARASLEQLKAGGQFPDANLRRMQAVVVYQLE